MTPVEKGRFCASCQKVVHDFTRSSDKEIAEIYLKDNTTCGKFHSTQLGRTLTVSANKKSVWFTASTAILSFIALGSNEVHSQTPQLTEQLEKETTKTNLDSFNESSIISGTVIDQEGLPIPNANIFNRSSGANVQTDFDGRYFIEAGSGDIIECSYIGYKIENFTVSKQTEYNIQFKPDYDMEIVMVVYGRPDVKRTFFGRLIHAIGNLFRKS